MAKVLTIVKGKCVVDIIHIVKSLPGSGGIFWVGIGRGGYFDVIHIAFGGFLGIGANGLEVGGSLFGVYNALKGFLILVVVSGCATGEAIV